MINKTKTVKKFKDRDWQIEAFKIIDRCNCSNKLEVIPINACVGSGKTNVAAYALGSFINTNKGKKTIQVFVTPRIKLCAQQAKEIPEFIERKFGLINSKDYDIIRKDCTQHELNLSNEDFTSKHAIIVICDESLWGTDNNATDPEKRWHSWIKFFEKRDKDGYVVGNVIFDESHNFTDNYEYIGV